MATFEELAPIISGAGITQTQVENYFANIPEKPEPQPEPEITTQKIVDLANLYFGGQSLAEMGGIAQVASDVGLTVDQVKMLVAEFGKLYSVWQELQGNE